MGWIDADTFEFFVPAQIVKSSQPAKKGEKSGKRWIQGIASTDNRDLQGEIVDQHGIDLAYFLKYGYFNNDHKPGFKNKVGQPTEARIQKNGLWVKGYLFENHDIADEIWGLMHSLETTQADRRLGFSIQGKVKRREGNVIKECWIQDIAVTPAPVNTTTWAEIAKSLSAQKWDLDKQEKAVSAGSGSPLSVESLEGAAKKDRADEDSTSKALTYEETVAFLENHHGLPRDAAADVAKAIFNTMVGEE
jgi:hypothetical protein